DGRAGGVVRRSAAPCGAGPLTGPADLQLDRRAGVAVARRHIVGARRHRHDEVGEGLELDVVARLGPRGPEIGSAVLVESRVLETVEGIGEHRLRYPRGTTQPVQGRADVVPAPRTGSHAVDLLVHVPGARTEGG